ncbi:sensor histidine kinase [Desulfohalobium retbaense]|uniref:histidine kinase n=1 Tax=Desulfohalobium retbaense (strain ATCC 49708 / DSM 5692 / JCM 16813 / HR100) TaxID=485915 RepID=C8X3Y6_DESRD|nr:HAMP domain-containing sensor histidine kinase [Desulfohalobium retbaense]ACV69133.1 histidine kinase [Desulfohalobium retbaense DSM 5692]
MRQPRSFVVQVLIFVLAQVAWLVLLGLWIYWYTSNYMVISEVGPRLHSQLMSEGLNHLLLIGGLILLIAISTGMSLLFHRLSVQFKLTRLYDNFIANVTHELKSPLASIQLSIETMRMHELPREKQEEFFNMMLKDTDRLNNLISAILQVPALEQKKIAHDFQVHRMEELVPELVHESREQFSLPEKAIQISGDGGCDCVLDRNAFRIVLDNLVDNSIKYSREGVDTAIHIRMACERGKFILRFADNGVGIPLQHQEQVFEKFFRSHDTAMPSVKGTGLGLYWVKEIIRIHQGAIRVSSRGTNKGSTFRIELPQYAKGTERAAQRLLRLSRKQKQKDTAHGEGA